MNQKNTYGAERRDEMKRKIIGMTSKQIQELSTQINIPFGTLTRWASEARHAVAKADKYRHTMLRGKDYATLEISREAIERAKGPVVSHLEQHQAAILDAAKEARRAQIKELLINLIKEL
jgi:hypothetical protein